MTTIIAKRKPDGTLVHVGPDGHERELAIPVDEERDMSDEEIVAAAMADPDNPPMTDGQLARMRPVAKSKRIRWKLHLSREEFAARYRIPLEVITAWERYQTEPDAVARAYLDVIAADPDGVAHALEAKLTVTAAE